jgi:hypothetical protein
VPRRLAIEQLMSDEEDEATKASFLPMRSLGELGPPSGGLFACGSRINPRRGHQA